MKERKVIKAEDLGGSEESKWKEYDLPDEEPYFNKEEHLKRSLVHQPNHKKAARKKGLLNKSTKLTS